MLDDSLKRAKQKTVGLKQTQRALEKGDVRRVYLAGDADAYVIRPVLEFCQRLNVEIVHVDSMAELGKACGIEVGASVVGVLEE